MSQSVDLAAVFEKDRLRLRRIAHGLLGDWHLAEDAVQEAWLKANHLRSGEMHNPAGLLTTITTRVCLDRLRQRRRNPLAALEDPGVEGEVAQLRGGADPEAGVLAADSIGLALAVVLERLRPLERVAFVLHEVFALPFAEIALVIDRSPAAARQLASRARRRLRGAREVPGAGLERQRALAETFLASARSGELAGLLRLLHPEVALTGDSCAAKLGLDEPLAGAVPVATFFGGRAATARVAVIEGGVWVIVGPRARPLLVVLVQFERDRIAGLHAVAEPLALGAIEPLHEV